MAGALGLIIALGLWGSALLRNVHLGQMGNLGLLSVLPVTYWAALGVLTVSFCWSVRRRDANQWVLAAHVVVLIAILHGTPAILYGTLRYSWAYKHVGIVSYIVDHGGVNLTDPSLTVYQDWPGFFALNAFLGSASGVHSAMGYAAWGPPVNELLYLGPLLLIFRSFTGDRRIVWTAVWIFYIGNWVGQDYFSPQAFAFFLYLVIAAICLRQLRVERPPWLATRLFHKDPPEPGSLNLVPADRHDARMAYGFVVVLALVIASSHQLTPVMLVAALVLLAIGGGLRYRSLPVVVALICVGWVVTAARPFLKTNVETILSGIGHPFGNTTSTLLNLSTVSRDQVIIADLDRLLTVGIMALALVGWWRNRRAGGGHAWFPAVLLVIAPISAVGGNDYGGEIGFRVYMFALPFLALFGSYTFSAFGRRRRVGVPNALRVVVVTAALGLFLFANYGKESANYFPQEEVSVMEHLYAMAPDGSLIVSPTTNIPWGFSHYDYYTYDWIAGDPAPFVKRFLNHPVETMAKELASGQPRYLILSRSENDEVEQDGVLPLARLQRAEWSLLHSPLFRVVAKNPSITVLTLGHPGAVLLSARAHGLPGLASGNPTTAQVTGSGLSGGEPGEALFHALFPPASPREVSDVSR